MDYVKEKNNNLYDFVTKDIYIALKKEEFNNEINIIDLGNDLILLQVFLIK